MGGYVGGSQPGNKTRLIVDGEDRSPIIRLQDVLDETCRGCLLKVETRNDAARYVHQQRDVERHLFRIAKLRDLLRSTILFNMKVGRLQTENGLSLRVGNRNRYHDEV